MRFSFLAVLLFAGAAIAQQAQQAPQQDPVPPAQETQQERQVTQPGNNAPVWNKVQSGAPAFTSIPGRETNVLIQPQARFPGQDQRTTAGEAWRQFRNGPITFYGGGVGGISDVAPSRCRGGGWSPSCCWRSARCISPRAR